jgi:hypothetical protein
MSLRIFYFYEILLKKVDTNGGGAIIIGEPTKRTSMIYMKRKASSDIVFTSNAIKRSSISMNRQ